jgi:hypothetical protein
VPDRVGHQFMKHEGHGLHSRHAYVHGRTADLNSPGVGGVVLRDTVGLEFEAQQFAEFGRFRFGLAQQSLHSAQSAQAVSETVGGFAFIEGAARNRLDNPEQIPCAMLEFGDQETGLRFGVGQRRDVDEGDDGTLYPSLLVVIWREFHEVVAPVVLLVDPALQWGASAHGQGNVFGQVG